MGVRRFPLAQVLERARSQAIHPLSKSRAPTAKGGYTSGEVFTRQVPSPQPRPLSVYSWPTDLGRQLLLLRARAPQLFCSFALFFFLFFAKPHGRRLVCAPVHGGK